MRSTIAWGDRPRSFHAHPDSRLCCRHHARDCARARRRFLPLGWLRLAPHRLVARLLRLRLSLSRRCPRWPLLEPGLPAPLVLETIDALPVRSSRSRWTASSERLVTFDRPRLGRRNEALTAAIHTLEVGACTTTT